MKLHQEHVMELDLILKVHAARTINTSNVLGIRALIIMQVKLGASKSTHLDNYFRLHVCLSFCPYVCHTSNFSQFLQSHHIMSQMKVA